MFPEGDYKNQPEVFRKEGNQAGIQFGIFFIHLKKLFGKTAFFICVQGGNLN